MPGWSPEALALLPGLRSFPALSGARGVEAALPPRPDSFQVGTPFLSQLEVTSLKARQKCSHRNLCQPAHQDAPGEVWDRRLSSWPPGPQRPTHPSGMNELRRAGTWPRSRPIFPALPAHAAAERGEWISGGGGAATSRRPRRANRKGGASTRSSRLSELGGRWRRALSGGSESTPGAPVRAGGGERRGGGAAAVASMCYAAQ